MSTSSELLPRRISRARLAFVLVVVVCGTGGMVRAGEPSVWPTDLAVRAVLGNKAAVSAGLKAHPEERQRLDIVADWAAQDRVAVKGGLDTEGIRRIIAALGTSAVDLAARARTLAGRKVAPNDARWAALYLEACHRRRAARLAPWASKIRRVVFTKHYDLGGSHYAYTEGQSDAQRERHFRPGSSLCLLEMDGLWPKATTLLDDPKGVIRDPDVSHDGRRILFAWKKDLNQDDYHLYEMDASTRKVRQLTSGLGVADYEGAYLPNGEIVFNSTRCIQTVDCWWTEVSNLYLCDADGGCLRRVSYDQVHTNYPQVTPDGRVLYTRWDYNDRGQIYPQGLFQMYPDGTAQTENYGNNSWFPTAILHARGIPGSRKIVAIFSGHHTRQKGWLGLLDPVHGRQENQGAQLIAPVRKTDAVRVDRYGQGGDQFQYPYPLSEDVFLVTFKPGGSRRPFAIHLMDSAGRRELLASDPKISCNQPVPLRRRPTPPRRPNRVAYSKSTGVFYLQDVHDGPGLAGVERGTIKSLRVVALEYRAAGVGSNGNRGPAGGALVSTPVSIQGTWDVKIVLGTTPVHPDGSACFVVPAQTPVYFQALDAKNHAVQTMRSWAQLQPGEFFACAGCHESKNTAPPAGKLTAAMKAGPQPLTPWYGPPRGFSFHREIQPILDRHCIRCHHQSGAKRADRRPTRGRKAPKRPSARYDPRAVRSVAGRSSFWRYTFDKPDKGWTQADYDDFGWKFGRAGFGTAARGVRPRTPWDTKDIWLRRTFTIKTDQVPTSPALVIHHGDEAEVHLNGVPAARLKGATKEYVLVPIPPEAARALRPGQNTLAVHCRFTGGGQFIDVGLAEMIRKPPKPGAGTPPATPVVKTPAGIKPAFSLKGAPGTWSPAYRALANRKVASWISVQSVPSMLAPYHAGAAKSKLITMLEGGHNSVELSQEEMDKIACWIDLLVPCFGDYREGLTGKNLQRYEHFLEKRKCWEAVEQENIRLLLGGR